ncbi:MAG: hypothetical protein IBJ13_05410 [Sphingopyxis sp.]|nr:hypothetical protein [Sphingopyxis sp.]
MRIKRGAVLTAAGLAILAAGAVAYGGTADAPRSLKASNDWVVRLATGTDPLGRCFERIDESERLAVYGFIGPRACYSFDPPREFSGIYVDEFEGQQFIQTKNLRLPVVAPAQSIWLDFDTLSDLGPLKNKPDDGTQLWHVRFIGRQANSSSAYGHMGMSDGAILVDRVLSATMLANTQGYAGPDLLVRANP